MKTSTQSDSILILNQNKEKAVQLKRICHKIGSVYTASDISQALSLTLGKDLNAVVVDVNMASYSYLNGVFKKNTSILIIGSSMAELKSICKEWPGSRFVDILLYSDLCEDSDSFLRTLYRAIEHSNFHIEIDNLRFLYKHNEIELREAFFQINEIKKFMKKAVVTELEKRISIESKFNWFKNEKQKIENILKNIYMANDITSLLDIAHDIKELIKASGISIYILEESEATGKFLKTLVWDNAILSHTDFNKHIIPIEAQDFAANTALQAQEINTTEIAYDKRLSSRYKQDLKSPLISILCVPVMHQKDAIGVLEVYNKNHNGHPAKSGFTKQDQQILQQLSEHISIAITKLNLIQYDPLTGLLRADTFFDKTIHKIRSKRRRQIEVYAYGLVMGDIDWFKNYNDRNGHEAGNRLLRELASILKSSTRDEDLVCRYGGEEFLFFLTGIKNFNESLNFTDRVRRNIENYYFPYQEYQPTGNLTMSFGIANFTLRRFKSLDEISKQDLKKIVNEAYMALADAKGKRHAQFAFKGVTDKNRIVVYKEKPGIKTSDINSILPDNKTYPIEKRKHHRYYTSTPLIYNDGSDRKVTKTINVSVGGVKFLADEFLTPEQMLNMTLILGNQTLDCQAHVVYSEKGTYGPTAYYSGVKFSDLSGTCQTKLEKYFSTLVAKKGLPS